MERFAKLYETPSMQILVTKEQADDGKPALTIRGTTRSGHQLSISIEFKGKKSQQFERRDEAFEKMTKDDAAGIISKAPGANI